MIDCEITLLTEEELEELRKEESARKSEKELEKESEIITQTCAQIKLETDT